MTEHYVKKSSKTTLLTYQYSGSDASITYNYLLSPLAAYILDFVPEWIAPNVITLTGFFFVMLGYVLSTIYSPNFDSVLPWYISLAIGVCTMFYQTLDNLDGKQARKTGSSSPLGLLFDHGIDAASITLSTLSLAAVYGLGTELTCVLWFIGFSTFALATWEQFYTGHLYLGVINGPSDGVLVAIVCCYVDAAFPGFWRESLSVYGYDVRRHLFVLGLALLAAVVTIACNIVVVFRASREKGFSMLSSLSALFPFQLIFAMGVAWMGFDSAYTNYPRVLLCLLGDTFFNSVVKLMLAHLCHQKFTPARWSSIPLVLAFANMLLAQNEWWVLSVEMGLWMGLAASMAFTLHFVYYCIREMCEILEIRCLQIPARATDII